MNKVQIRTKLVQHLEVLLAKWESEGRSMFVDTENQEELDLTTVGDKFMVFHIEWTDTVQKNVAENPDHRYYGDVVIILFGKVGTGTVDRLALEDEITEHFKFKQLGGVQLKEPTPGGAGRPEKRSGWHSITVSFPFFADSNA
jgi:hypothetical protein